ncbi:MAG: hypothetical protein WAO76_00390 [Georgfuchsia sp.]
MSAMNHPGITASAYEAMAQHLAQQIEVADGLRKRLANALDCIAIDHGRIEKLRDENSALRQQIMCAAAPLGWAHVWESGMTMCETREEAVADIEAAFRQQAEVGQIDPIESYVCAVMAKAVHVGSTEWTGG